jgi:hypothetical protein
VNFKLSVIYGDQVVSVNEFEHLSAEKVEQGLAAFLRDMLTLEGSAVSKITIEREQ